MIIVIRKSHIQTCFYF